ncbi:hypothetical protein BDY24DRAFT_160203 [Mrakia frigida]|uniref:uncharacterized protein n=1 Tax=Mrakia frigida TaxID=29902 RepID=UPI003FCC0B96
MASDSTHKQCMGSIQFIDPSIVDGMGDFIFGSAFMRNSYTVLSGPKYTDGGKWTTPALALLPLTATNSSSEEFYRVRTLNQAIVPSTSTTPSSPGASGIPVTSTTGVVQTVSKTVFGTGPIVGVAIGGLLLLAVGVFLSRYLCLKRRYRKNGGNGGDVREKGVGAGAMGGGGGHDPFGASGMYAHVPALPSSPGSSIAGGATTTTTPRSEQEKIKDIYRARTDRGSTGSSTLRSFSDQSEDEGKGGWAAADRPRKSSVASDKFMGNSSRQGTHSILGGGYDELEYENGIMGTDAPTRRLDDDDDEDEEGYQSLGMPSPRADSLSTVDGYAAVPVKAWRIQQDGQPSSDYSTRPMASTRSPSESSLSAADSLLLARREARRSRSESPSAAISTNPHRTSSAPSTSTVSSSSTLHLGSLPPPNSSSPHHFYPPLNHSSSSSSSSPQSTPTNLPTPSPSHRPSLFVFSNLTPSTIIESPFTSPVQGEPFNNNTSLNDPTSSSVLKGLPPPRRSSASSSSIPRGPNQQRSSIDSTGSHDEPMMLLRKSVESEGFTESPEHSPGLGEGRGALLEGT